MANPNHAAVETNPPQVQCAHEVLARYEVRRIDLAGGSVIGVWSDQDSPAIRAALKIVGWGDLPIRYLDSSGVADQYKGSKLPAGPPPLAVVRAMEAEPHEPWLVRDRMLAGAREYPSLEAWLAEQRRAAFANKSAPRPPEEPVPDSKPVARGWSSFVHWSRWHPVAAVRYRAQHSCADETAWLLELSITGRKLKLLLNRLEEALEETRAAIRHSRYPEAANQRFLATFRRELEFMAQPEGGLELSYESLKRLLPMLKRLRGEIEDEGTLLSLYG